jgi:adenylylsulfate kinase-like enzyme
MCRDSSHFSMPPEIQPVRIDKTEKENILDALFSFDDVSQCNKQKDQLDSSIHFRHGNDDLLRGGKSVCSEEQITPFKRRKDRVDRTHYSIEGRSIKRIKYSGTFTDHERSIILRRVADIISFVQQQCHLHIQYFLSLREKEETKVKNASISVQKFNIYSDEALRVLMAKHSNKSYDPHVVKEITLIVSVYALCGRCRTFEEEKIMQSIVEKGDMSLASANVDTLIKILSPRVICINESIPTDMVRLVASLMEFNCSMKQQVVSTTSGYCYNCQQPLCGRENVDHACEICGAVELFDMPPITNAFQFDDLFGSGRCFFSNTTLFSRFSNSPQGQQRIKVKEMQPCFLFSFSYNEIL